MRKTKLNTVVHRGLSRRALLGRVALGAAAWRLHAEIDSPLKTLKPEHPRLILNDAELPRIRSLTKENPLARRLFADLLKEAERLLGVLPLDLRSGGMRIPPPSRRVLERIYTLALVYRLDGRKAFLDRAVREMHSAASINDWNPAHFPEVAEVTQAMGIGYDWLHAGLSPGERVWIKKAMVDKGLDPAIAAYSAGTGWVTGAGTWNLISNAGLGIGALAIADEEPEKCGAVMRGVLESIPHGMAVFNVDGGWPEGPGLFHAGTEAAACLVAAMESALGTDFGVSAAKGLDHAGRSRVYAAGPSGKTIESFDLPDDSGTMPEMFWLARRFGQPVLAWYEERQVERAAHADALDLVWYPKEAKSPQAAGWPLDALIGGGQVAVFRSAWEDPSALFLSVKAGENKAWRAHFEPGSFALMAGGVRWSMEMGPFPRLRTEFHNSILIDDEGPDSKAEARVVKREFTPDLAWVQIDLSKTYPAKVKSLTRRIGLAQRQAVLIEDRMVASPPVEFLWQMITEAELTFDGQNAEMQKDGWTLLAEIHTPRHAVFDVVTPASAAGQGAGIKKLVVRLGEKVSDLDLNVSLTPYKTGTPRPKIAVKFPAA